MYKRVMNPELKLQVGVKALVENSNGELLFLRKNGEISKTSNFWDIPGGRIEVGQSLRDNLIREIKEETQLDLSETQELIDMQDIIKPEKGIHVVRLTYHIKLEKEYDEVVLDAEHLEFVWMNGLEMKNNPEVDPYLIETLEKFYEKNN